MWIYIIGGIAVLSVLAFSIMAFIFYKAMKVIQRDEQARKEEAAAHKIN